MKKKLINIITRNKLLTDIAFPLFIIATLALFIPLTGLIVGNGQVEISNLNWLCLFITFVTAFLYAYFVMKYSPFQRDKEKRSEQMYIARLAEKRGVSFEEAQKIYDVKYPPLEGRE